jgi:hypothetical protein
MESLFSKMISHYVEERPIHEEILGFKTSWALNAREFASFINFDEFQIVHLSKFKSHPLLHKFIHEKIVRELKSKELESKFHRENSS